MNVTWISCSLLPLPKTRNINEKSMEESEERRRRERYVQRLAVETTWRCQKNPFIGALGSSKPLTYSRSDPKRERETWRLQAITN